MPRGLFFLFSSFTLAVADFSACGQELINRHNRFQFGITGSLSTSFSETIENATQGGFTSSSSEKIPTIGYKAGFLVRYTLSKRFFVNGGLSYASENTKIKTVSFNPDDDLDIVQRYSWLEVPLNINFKINPKSINYFFVGVGVSPRRLLKASEQFTLVRTGIGNQIVGDQVSNENTLNDWNMLGTGCVGFNWQFSSKATFVFSLYFERNLFKLVRDVDLNTTTSFQYQTVLYDYRINTFSFNIAYLFF